MTLIILPAARKESEQAAEWYEDQRPGLGGEFLLALAAAYEDIERHPHRPLRIRFSGIGEREFHQKMIRRFPYKIIYEVRVDEILVVAVAHTSRKPHYWADRA
jgi:toxin ParE1/3/4